MIKFTNLLQNHGAIFNHTWHKTSFAQGIYVCSSEGQRAFTKGDNNKIAKIH